MTKMPNKYPKYPKTLENDPKTTTIPTETFKTTKIPLDPQNKQSTLETFENDLNIPKLSQKNTRFFRLCGYFGRFQVALLILDDFMAFCSF